MVVQGEPEKSSSAASDTNIGFLRAARAGNTDKVLDGITRQGVDINCSNANGLNALHLTAKEGYTEQLRQLIQRGAKVDATTKKGNTALHIACLGGKLEVAKILVENGSPINAQSQLGFTPLYMAAQENHQDIVKFLLDMGADPSLTTEEGYTPLAVALQQRSEKAVTVLLEYGQGSKIKLPALHIAAKKDDVSAAKLLLKSETADKESMVELVNDTTKSGFTPLHIAAHYGKITVARLLIEMGADVNYKAKNAIAPLHVAAKWGQLNMIVLLLEKGALINIQTRDGLTPLHCATRSGYVRVVDYLLECQADHSSKTRNGLAPLHMAAQGDHTDCARLILHAKASVNEVNVDYLTALHVCAHYGHVKTAKLLLDRNSDVNARALNGFTPLHIACKKNRIKVVELLLKFGALIEATTESGLTPLHVSSFMGNMSIVLILLNNGAMVDGRTMRGETPLHLSARANQTDVMRILLRNKADVNAKAREQQCPLHIAARMGSVDNVLLLLQHGADPEAVTKDGYTPLHITAKEGHEDVVSVLIDQSASPNSVTKKGMAPLHIAAKYGQLGVARLLLQRGALPDLQGRNGLTALHVAVHYSKGNIVLLLLEEFRASPHCQAKNGYTPLHIAVKKNHMDIATSLIEYGARPNAESKNGFSPLHLASQEAHTDMVSLVLENGANANCYATNGLTPMHLCAQEDHVQVAEILRKYDAAIDPTTKAGYTPLHTASHFGQINMVRYLLELGADVNARTRLGYAPIHQAAQQGHVLVVNILLKAGADPDAKTYNGVTALQIARRLGYVSVEQVLQSVTTVSASTEDLHEDYKYSLVGPEKMEEHSISDSEDEQDADEVFTHQYPFLSQRDDYIQGAARPGDSSFKIDSSSVGGALEQDATIRTHNFDDSELYAEENYVEQLSPISRGSVRQYVPTARSRTSLNSAREEKASPMYLSAHSPKPTAHDNVSEGYAEPWKTQPDDSAPPDENEDQPAGGVFIPPKDGDPKMYDIYKSPEEIIAVTDVKEQESAAPEYMEDADSEPGYVLTTTGEVIGPDGKPLQGADRKPIVLVHDKHSRYSLAADGTIYGPDHKPFTDSEGNIIRVKPSGNKIILEPSGKLTLDDKRNPLVVEAGTQLVTPLKDGRVKVKDKPVIDCDTGKVAAIRHATPDTLVVVGPDMRTVNILGKPVTVVGGSVLITPGLQNYIVFANGRPVIGEDNEPVCVPAGSKLIYPNIDRTVTNSAGNIVTDGVNKPVIVVDKFCAAVIMTPNQEIVRTKQTNGDVRVPVSSHLVSGADDGTLVGPDKKKILGPDGKAIKVNPTQKVVVDKHGQPVLGADSKPIIVPTGSCLLIPHADGRVVRADGTQVVADGGKAMKVNPESSWYIVSKDHTLVTDRDGHFVRVEPGTQLVTPGKDGKIKGNDGKKIQTADGKTAKVDVGKEPVVVEPGNRLLKNKENKPLRVPVGSQVVVPDDQGYITTVHGEPVYDKQGRQMQILPNLCKVILGPEDKPLTDKNGKIITVPGGSRLTIPGQEEAILGPDGKAITNEKGIPLGVDQGSSLLPVSADQCVYLPDGAKLTTAEGKIFKHTPGSVIAIGPDYHPVVDKDGEVVVVPEGSVVIAPRQKYVLDNEGHPVSDHRGRSIAVDSETIILQADSSGEILLQDGTKLCDSAGRPIVTAPEQEVLVDVDTMKPVLDSRGQPVVTKAGVSIAQPGQLLYIVCPDKTVVEDDNSQPVWVTPGTRLLAGDKDGYASVGKAGKLLDKTNFPLRIPANQEAVVGPDDKPVCYKNAEPVFVPEGSVIMAPGEDFLRDLDGNPVKDAQGHPLTVEPGTTIHEADNEGLVKGPDDLPLTDKYGKPVVAAPRSLLLVSPAGKIVNSPRGRPVPVPRGSRITPVQHDVVIDDEGNLVMEANGLPLQVTPGTRIMEAGKDGYLTLPDDQRVTDVNGATVLLPPGQCALIGPDGKAVVDANGEVVTVPKSSSIHSSPAPPLQKVQRPQIIEDIIAQEVADTAEASAPQQHDTSSMPRKGLRGVFAETGSPTTPPPLPSTLPPGSMPWSVFTLRREKTIEASYSGTAFGTDFNPDNVVVERSPVFTGFVVSFMVDARGGAMRGSRHAGVRIVIPPGMATGPTRVTCRMLKKEKLSTQPPLNDGEALAARVVSLGPVGTSFLGPVIIEIPHFASLRNNEREIQVLKSLDGKKWEEHKLKPSDDLVFNAVNGSFDDIEPLDELEQKRITRIVTTEFPKYFALVSRNKIETCMVGPEGAIISSTVVPQAQAVFPAGALKKPTKIGLQIQPVPADVVAKLFGNRAAVSPIVTLEPRRRQFRKPVTLTFPLPRAASKGMTNNYSQGSSTLRLLSSMADGNRPAEWRDVTSDQNLQFINDCVSFTTTVSARFWLVDYQQVPEILSMANVLYKEVCHVPFMSRFVVFGKRHEQREARLRVFCMTDDKIDKTLETQQHFTEVARSRDIEVLESKEQWLEMAGNLIPITRTDDTQLHINFQAFQENRLPFIVRIRDQDREPTGRVAFMREPKVPKGGQPQIPLCNLQITLPDYNEDMRTASDLDLSRTSDFNERYKLYRDHGVSFISENIVSANLRLPEIAQEVGSDWPRLAQELNISNKDVDRLQASGHDEQKQALSMLQLWMKQAGIMATGNTLERALQRISREDVTIKCIHSVKAVTSEKEKEVARKELGIEKEADELVVPKDEDVQDITSTNEISTTNAETTESKPESPAVLDADEDFGVSIPVETKDEILARYMEEQSLAALQWVESAEEDPNAEIVASVDSSRPFTRSPREAETSEQQAERQQMYLGLIADLEAASPMIEISDDENDESESIHESMEKLQQDPRPQLEEDFLPEEAIAQQSSYMVESIPVTYDDEPAKESLDDSEAPAEVPLDYSEAPADEPVDYCETEEAIAQQSSYMVEFIPVTYDDEPAEESLDDSEAPAEVPADYSEAPADELVDYCETEEAIAQQSSYMVESIPVTYDDEPAEESLDDSEAPAEVPLDYSETPADEPVDYCETEEAIAQQSSYMVESIPVTYDDEPAKESLDDSEAPADEPVFLTREDVPLSFAPGDEQRPFSLVTERYSEEHGVVEPTSPDVDQQQSAGDEPLAGDSEGQEPVYEIPVSHHAELPAHQEPEIEDEELTEPAAELVYEIPVSHQTETEDSGLVDDAPQYDLPPTSVEAGETDSVQYDRPESYRDDEEPVYEEVTPSTQSAVESAPADADELEAVTPIAEDDVIVASSNPPPPPSDAELQEMSARRQEAYLVFVKDLEQASLDVMVDEEDTYEGESVDDTVEITSYSAHETVETTTYIAAHETVEVAEYSLSTESAPGDDDMHEGDASTLKSSDHATAPDVTHDVTDDVTDDKWKDSSDEHSSTNSHSIADEDFEGQQIGGASYEYDEDISADLAQDEAVAPETYDDHHQFQDGSYLSDEPAPDQLHITTGDAGGMMTLEEAEILTSSTLSDSTQMTLSNVSSQPMSVSIHSEVSAISQLSETEKHEVEDTIESGTEEYSQGFDEIQECAAASEDENVPPALDEKCVVEMKFSEKHVRFPGDEATTDVLYTNEQLSQSVERLTASATSSASLGEEVESLKFVHCAVDELSRGRPKEKTSQEEKESSSMVSSTVTDTSMETQTPSEGSTLDETFDQLREVQSATPTNMTGLIQTEPDHTRDRSSYQQTSGDDSSPDIETTPNIDFREFSMECSNGMDNTHKALSYTSSLDVVISSEVHSLHSDEPELSPTSSNTAFIDAPLLEPEGHSEPLDGTQYNIASEMNKGIETEVSDIDIAGLKTDLVVERLECGDNVILDDVSLVSKDYSSDESDAGLHRPRGLTTIEEMPTTIQPLRNEPPIDVTYESGLDLISSREDDTYIDTEPASPLYERSQSDQDLTRLSTSSLDKVRHHSSPDNLNSDASDNDDNGYNGADGGVSGRVDAPMHSDVKSYDNPSFAIGHDHIESVEDEMIVPETISEVQGACIGKLPSCTKFKTDVSDSLETYRSYDDLSRPSTIYSQGHSDEESEIPDFVFEFNSPEKEPSVGEDILPTADLGENSNASITEITTCEGEDVSNDLSMHSKPDGDIPGNRYGSPQMVACDDAHTDKNNLTEAHDFFPVSDFKVTKEAGSPQSDNSCSSPPLCTSFAASNEINSETENSPEHLSQSNNTSPDSADILEGDSSSLIETSSVEKDVDENTLDIITAGPLTVDFPGRGDHSISHGDVESISITSHADTFTKDDTPVDINLMEAGETTPDCFESSDVNEDERFPKAAISLVKGQCSDEEPSDGELSHHDELLDNQLYADKLPYDTATVEGTSEISTGDLLAGDDHCVTPTEIESSSGIIDANTSQGIDDTTVGLNSPPDTDHEIPDDSKFTEGTDDKLPFRAAVCNASSVSSQSTDEEQWDNEHSDGELKLDNYNDDKHHANQLIRSNETFGAISEPLTGDIPASDGHCLIQTKRGSISSITDIDTPSNIPSQGIDDTIVELDTVKSTPDEPEFPDRDGDEMSFSTPCNANVGTCQNTDQEHKDDDKQGDDQFESDKCNDDQHDGDDITNVGPINDEQSTHQHVYDRDVLNAKSESLTGDLLTSSGHSSLPTEIDSVSSITDSSLLLNITAQSTLDIAVGLRPDTSKRANDGSELSDADDDKTSLVAPVCNTNIVTDQSTDEEHKVPENLDMEHSGDELTYEGSEDQQNNDDLKCDDYNTNLVQSYGVNNDNQVNISSQSGVPIEVFVEEPLPHQVAAGAEISNDAVDELQTSDSSDSVPRVGNSSPSVRFGVFDTTDERELTDSSEVPSSTLHVIARNLVNDAIANATARSTADNFSGEVEDSNNSVGEALKSVTTFATDETTVTKEAALGNQSNTDTTECIPLAIDKDRSVHSLSESSDTTEKQCDFSSPLIMSDSGTSYDFGSSVEDVKDSDETTDTLYPTKSTTSPNHGCSAEDLTLTVLCEEDSLRPKLGSSHSRPSFGGLSGISSEGERRLSLSDVESDSEQRLDTPVKFDTNVHKLDLSSHSTTFSSADASVVGGSYVLETGQVTDLLSDHRQVLSSGDSTAPTLSTSISDEVFTDHSQDRVDKFSPVEPVSLPPTVDPLSSIIDFGMGERVQSPNKNGSGINSCGDVDSGTLDEEPASRRDSIVRFSDDVTILLQDDDTSINLGAPLHSPDIDHHEFSLDSASIHNLVDTGAKVPDSASFEATTDFTSHQETDKAGTCDLASQIVAQAIADSVKLYRQEISPSADDSRSGSSNSIYDNLLPEESSELDEMVVIEGDEFSLYQNRQLSAVEELSESEGSVSSGSEEKGFLDTVLEHIYPNNDAQNETKYSDVEPAKQHSDITESSECLDDDVDISSVDSYNTVILPDGESQEPEDRLTEIASMTSSIASDTIGGADLPLIPLPMIEPSATLAHEPTTPRMDECQNSTISTPSSEVGVIQKFPKLNDTDTVSVSSSLAEFEQLESQVGHCKDSPRSSLYGDHRLKRPVEKDQESVSSSVLEFEHLETTIADSDSASQPSPYHKVFEDSSKTQSTNSLYEFETLEVDVESEEVQREANKVVQHLEELNAEIAGSTDISETETSFNSGLVESENGCFENIASSMDDFSGLRFEQVASLPANHASSTNVQQSLPAGIDRHRDEKTVYQDDTVDSIQRIIDEAAERIEEIRAEVPDSVLLGNIESNIPTTSIDEALVRPKQACTVMSEAILLQEPTLSDKMESSIDSLIDDDAEKGLTKSCDSLVDAQDQSGSVMSSSISSQERKQEEIMVKSVDSIGGERPSLMEKSLDSLSSEVIHEPYLQESPVNALTESVYQDMVSSTASAAEDQSLMITSSDSLGMPNASDPMTVSTDSLNLERDMSHTASPAETSVETRSTSDLHKGGSTEKEDEDAMSMSFHQSYPAASNPFAPTKDNCDSDNESKSTTSSRSSHSTRLREFYESDYRYEPRQKVFTMADVEAEREAKRTQRGSRCQSPASSTGSQNSEAGESAEGASKDAAASELGSTRVHWVKQRLTRTRYKDGVAEQEVVTERILMHQSGDEPPMELQEKIDQLASNFKNCDISPPSS